MKSFATVTLSRLALILLPALAGACGHTWPDDPAVAAQQERLEVVVDPPADVNCFSLSLRNQENVEISAQVALAPTMNFDVPVGVYQATARAYQAAACTSPPGHPTWGTAAPAILIVQAGQTASLSLQLFRVGQVGVTPEFVATPEVVATNQGALGPIAAAGDRVAWVVGQNIQLATDEGAGLFPQTVASGQSNPMELSVDPARGDIYWINGVSGDRDAGGQLVKDGSVWRWDSASGGAAAIADQVVPLELDASLGSAYWADSEANVIDVFSPATGTVSHFITNQTLANSVKAVSGAMANQLVWTTLTGAVRLVNLPGTTPVDVYVTPMGDARQPVSVIGDGTDVFWTDLDPMLNDSRILRAPATGGAAQVLYPPAGQHLGLSFGILVAGDFVYVTGFDGIRRLHKDGSGTLELVQSGQIRGRALTARDGATYLYWTDARNGGLIWRLRLQ
jgi:hypothetical protein